MVVLVTVANKLSVFRYICQYGWSVGWRVIWASYYSQKYQYRERICCQSKMTFYINNVLLASVKNCFIGSCCLSEVADLLYRCYSLPLLYSWCHIQCRPLTLLSPSCAL